MSKRYSEDEKRWSESVLASSLKGAAERNVPPASHGVPEKKRLYGPSSESEIPSAIGFPGEFPFTRGIHPTMYRSRFWTMRQYAGFATARESNERYRYLLAQGQTGLSVAFDLPTQMGFDSDQEMARGEVGRVGVAIDTIDDMRTLLADLPLQDISTSMTINSTAPILLAFYMAVAEERGISAASLRGTVQNDLLKEYIARGTYIYPPSPSLRLIVDLMQFCDQHVPQWNTVSVSGYHIREAGSTAIQEVGFTLANGLTYLEAAKARGLSIDAISSRLSFFFNVHNDVLEEVAKFRAARRLWARLVQERFGVKDAKGLVLRFHAQTAGSMLTSQQPKNNIVRVTLQALAAVLGGAQSLHTNSMDEALGLPTEEAVTIALRTQQVLAYESGVTASVDPLGGSYMVESLTDAIEEGARKVIDRIDDLGGMVRAIEKGFPQREIQNSAYEYQQQIEKGQRIVVGVNRFEMEEDAGVPIMTIDPQVEKDQVARLQKFKSERDISAVKTALAEISVAARGSENLMPKILNAVKANASLGEISAALKEVFGAYHEVHVL